MNRAAVLIGVRKAHDLPMLQAVLEGVAGMHDWARSQGIPEDRIKTVTDENARVTPQDIKDAVAKLLQPGDLDQLIIYFAGHGVNVQYAEYWLLSDAIVDSDAAVNVKASEERARYSGVPHTVFISDACRTAAVGIQAQGILGSSIFLNPVASGPEKQVDLFFATLIGDPSLEIRDPHEAAQGFKAVYTDVLLEALLGQRPEVVEPEAGTGRNVVRPWPLKDFLARELPIRVYQLTSGSNPRSQQPDARITSRPVAWISAVPALTDRSTPPKFSVPAPADALKHAELTQMAIGRTELVTRSILETENTILEAALTKIPFAESISPDNLDLFSNLNRRYKADVRTLSEPFGPQHMETRCGFKIRGARLARLVGRNPSRVFDDGTGAQAEVLEHDACTYLLELHNGAGVLMPAIGGFLASLTFDNDNLIDVAYEPSEYTDRWHSFQEKAVELRTLRSAIASATRLGTFRLQGDDAAILARRMQLAKGIDPSLALYAAHAYRDQGNRARLREMAQFLQEDLGFCLFDIALLNGQLNQQQDAAPWTGILPFLPMLSQTWSLLPAYDVKLPAGLTTISRHVMPSSLWTLLDANGVRQVFEVFPKGALR